MSRHRDSQIECKVYVGGLPRDASEKELERAFSYYGPLRNVWVARNPPGFAFIEFDDPRDADDSVRGLDGTNVCGVRVRVERSAGKVRPKPWMQQQQSSQRSRAPPRMRRAFHPEDRCYECGGRGHYAYDCSRYKEGRSSGHKHRSGSRSHSRSRSRSHSHDRKRSASRSRSRSKSRERYRTRSRSVSRSPPRHSRERSGSRHRSVSPARNGDAD